MASKTTVGRSDKKIQKKRRKSSTRLLQLRLWQMASAVTVSRELT